MAEKQNEGSPNEARTESRTEEATTQNTGKSKRDWTNKDSGTGGGRGGRTYLELAVAVDDEDVGSGLLVV